jgi:hypothetical protein
VRAIPRKKRVLVEVSKGGTTRRYDYIDPSVPKQPKEVHVKESTRRVEEEKKGGMFDFLKRKKKGERPEQSAEQFAEFIRKE